MIRYIHYPLKAIFKTVLATIFALDWRVIGPIAIFCLNLTLHAQETLHFPFSPGNCLSSFYFYGTFSLVLGLNPEIHAGQGHTCMELHDRSFRIMCMCSEATGLSDSALYPQDSSILFSVSVFPPTPGLSLSVWIHVCGWGYVLRCVLLYWGQRLALCLQ